MTFDQLYNALLICFILRSKLKYILSIALKCLCKYLEPLYGLIKEAQSTFKPNREIRVMMWGAGSSKITLWSGSLPLL